MEGPDDIEDVERLVDEDDDGDMDLGVDDVNVEDILGSDDSVEGEDGGIVMRKTERASAWGRMGEVRRVVSMERKGVREDLD
jgi:hypothetical protein